MSHQPTLYAQGDIVLQPVTHTRSSKARDIPRDSDGAVVLARGELSGHRHVIMSDSAQFYREPEFMGRAYRDGNYVGHVTLCEDVRLQHEEHASIVLPAGNTYVVRRQRVFDPGLATRMLLAGD